MTTVGDMLFHMGGAPVMSGGQIPFSTGTYFFVDSGTGNSNNTGLKTTDPLATIDQAINKCTAAAGDVIIVFPGHAETISAATSMVVDIAGISIVGLGYGENRPVLTFSGTASRIPVSASDVRISGLIFYSNIADVVSGVTVTGDDVLIQGCEWRGSAANKEFLQMLDIDDTERVTVKDCKLIASTTAGTNTGIRLDTAHYTTIDGCELRGDFTTAAISGTAGSAAASTDVVVKGCLIENRDTTAGIVIDIHDTGTGLLANNRCFTLYATDPESALDPGNALCCETYVVNAVDESGTIVPVTLST